MLKNQKENKRRPVLTKGSTALYGIYGNKPLDRVWVFYLSVLNRVYDFMRLIRLSLLTNPLEL